MLRVNLEEELKAQPILDGKEEEIAKAFAEDVLNKASSEDIELLTKVGLYKAQTIAHAEVKKEEATLALKPGRIFNRNQIYQLAIRYGLRFLNVDFYKGAVDVRLAQAIRDYQQEFPHEVVDSTRLYILAPASQFRLKVRPVIKEDPMAFVEMRNGHYYLLQKWGKDLTILRRLCGFLGDPGGRILVATLTGLTIGGTCSYLTYICQDHNLGAAVGAFVLSLLPGIPISVGLGSIAPDYERLWDTPFKR